MNKLKIKKKITFERGIKWRRERSGGGDGEISFDVQFLQPPLSSSTSSFFCLFFIY